MSANKPVAHYSPQGTLVGETLGHKEFIEYIDSQVGHHTEPQRVEKLNEECEEVSVASRIEDNEAMIDECADVLTVVYHMAYRRGFSGSPNDMLEMAYNKMKRRVESGERDYINNKNF